eukprot:TRINITY_DN5483_c0_g1_i2.p1 TRINITY_DN5483_c0_g1~~TRINITY_DN5483_c0_g1_i2.p1  ORF type:complete len:198 (+),score=44.63 TRINITY_DN5483_c0_g1_i2:303-896(+)
MSEVGNSQLEEAIDELLFFTLPAFRFKHVFYPFKPALKDQIKERNIQILARRMQEIFKAAQKLLDNSDLSKDYNIVWTEKWFFVVLRSQEVSMGTIKLNAVGFTGSIVVKSLEDMEFLRKNNPFDILKDVGFPVQSLTFEQKKKKKKKKKKKTPPRSSPSFQQHCAGRQNTKKKNTSTATNKKKNYSRDKKSINNRD